MPLIWKLISKALAAGRKVRFEAVHMGKREGEFSPMMRGNLTEVREDGYIVDGTFLALFPEDDEWKTIKKLPDGTMVVCNKP